MLLALILRLSILLNRSRDTAELPSVGLQISLSHVELKFPKGYLDRHPLTGADLEQEAMYLGQVGITLGFA
jgi:exopolyphosphatase/guanosine-5'-triphosphate,3'-diphosphate pyrophosphatase